MNVLISTGKRGFYIYELASSSDSEIPASVACQDWYDNSMAGRVDNPYVDDDIITRRMWCPCTISARRRDWRFSSKRYTYTSSEGLKCTYAYLRKIRPGTRVRGIYGLR